jgi:hypothetical protein
MESGSFGVLVEVVDIFDVSGFSVIRQLVASDVIRINNVKLRPANKLPHDFAGKRRRLTIFAIC